ncbi:DPH3-like protein (CSL-type zinc finger-containing protein 2) [Mucor lusitanicus]|uniref:Diphthamide biosynthesis protein 3 n=1 Tax=Mucor circinelloides f. lusitanicus TaxID=29924 RepID=A0A8H4B7J9_MUCCL|nr:DPH3-like protein (CSL-type zinc finger-containing protein 2) [Mucor lusitanicus]
MASFYDEVEIEDMDYDEEQDSYTYPCPCGDKFIISSDELIDGLDVAQCPSCSLVIKVIYDPDDFIDEQDQTTTFQAEVINISA